MLQQVLCRAKPVVFASMFHTDADYSSSILGPSAASIDTQAGSNNIHLLLLPICLAIQDLLDAVFDVKHIPGWLSAVITVIFVWSNVLTSLVVTDLGEVLHMIGGTAASFMIFFLPGLLLMNAAIIKHTHSYTSLSQLVSWSGRVAVHM
jgi:hypothetical protein